MWLEPDGDGGHTPVVRHGSTLVLLLNGQPGAADELPEDLQLVSWLRVDGADGAAVPVLSLGTGETVDGRLVAMLDTQSVVDAVAAAEPVAIDATVCAVSWRGEWRGAADRLTAPLAAGETPQMDRLPATVELRELPVIVGPKGWRYHGADEAVRGCRAAYKAGDEDMVDVCEAAAARHAQAGDHRNQMLAVGLAGSALRRQGRLDQARARFEEAAELATRVPGGLPAEQTRFLRLAADACLNTGAYHDGLDLVERALAIDQAHGHLLWELRDRNYLGDVAYLLGDPMRCIDELRGALALSRMLRSEWDEFNTLTWMGTRYHDIGRYRHALSCMERAEPLLTVGPESPDHEREAWGVYLTDLGWLQLKARRRGLLDTPADEIAARFEGALAINEQQGHVLWQANSRMNLAELAIQEGRTTDALAQLDATRTLLAQASDFEHASYLLALEGELALVENRPAQALATFDRLAAAEGRWAAVWWADYGRARALSDLGRSGDAVRRYEDALASLEGAAALMDPLVDRMYFLGDRDEVYDRYAALLLDQGRPGQAFAVCERSRDRTAAAARGLSSAPGEDIVLDLATLARLAEANQALADHEVDEAFVHPERRDAWSERRAELVEQVVEAQAAVASALRAPTTEATGVALADLERALPEQATVLYYHVTADELLLLAIRRDGTRLFRIAIPRHELRRRVDDHDAGLATLLLPTGLRLRPEEQLVVVPHGPLHALSFATLRRGERYLVEDHALLVAPSGRALLQDDGTPGANGPAVVAADPTGDLRGARDEGRAIAAALTGSDLIEGDSVTRDAVLSALTTADTFHYAGHAVVDVDLPQHSHLRLAGGDRLTWMDLQSQQVDCALVVLSGCETGRSLTPAAGEAWGLATALLHAGADAVVASGWEVPDGPTRALMERFHAERALHPSPEALRRTQRAALAGELSADAAVPEVWGAFAVHGSLAALR